MKEKILYRKENSINGWEMLIESKFSNISIENVVDTITSELIIIDNNEIEKIKKANLIRFGKKLGVLSFEDACEKLKINPYDNLELLNQLSDDIKTKYVSEYKLKIIIKALNEGWYPNWEDENEYKWMNYFRMKGGFSSTRVYCDLTSTTVPSALCLKNKQLAYYVGNMFIDLYKDYYLR